MKSMVNRAPLLLFLTVFSGLSISESVLAKTLYISDQIYVPVRKGQGNQFQILHKGLATGTKVTLEEEDENWTKVTTPEGITGWVRNQYLSETPPSSTQLLISNQKLDAMRNELNNIKNENATLKNNFADTKSVLKETERNLRNTEEELNSIKVISASAVESHQRLQLLAEKMQLLQTENDVLKSENENLKRSERTTFFLYGVFTLLMGILVAVVVPKLRGRKRSDGWLN